MHGAAVTLEDSHCRLVIHPGRGGAIARFDWLGGEGTIPVFQPGRSPERPGVWGLGCNVLVPWSNRISGGGFIHEGVFHALDPNLPGEPYPNHGNAFDLEFRVVSRTDTQVQLVVDAEGPGPFRYRCALSYTLSEGTLSARLTLTNRAEIALPHGGGFHPWFVRTPETRLAFAARGVWSERTDHLPDAYHTLDTRPEFDFTGLRPLPAGWINSAFTGWDGSARIIWPERGLGLDMHARTPLTTLILYSPSADSDFVSIEPVSHSVDAHNRIGEGVAPPQILAPGEGLDLTVAFTPHRIVPAQTS